MRANLHQRKGNINQKDKYMSLELAKHCTYFWCWAGCSGETRGGLGTRRFWRGSAKGGCVSRKHLNTTRNDGIWNLNRSRDAVNSPIKNYLKTLHLILKLFRSKTAPFLGSQSTSQFFVLVAVVLSSFIFNNNPLTRIRSYASCTHTEYSTMDLEKSMTALRHAIICNN